MHVHPFAENRLLEGHRTGYWQPISKAIINGRKEEAPCSGDKGDLLPCLHFISKSGSFLAGDLNLSFRKPFLPVTYWPIRLMIRALREFLVDLCGRILQFASTEYTTSAEETGMESQEALRKIHSTGAEDASPGFIQETDSGWMFMLPFLHGPLYT